MFLSGVHHVAIIVSDYARSRHFYVDLLELPVVREHYQPARDSYKLDLRAGNLELEIFCFANAPARPDRPEALGLRHLAFGVPNLDRAIETLRQKGIETEPVRTDPYSGGRFTFFRDPDGLPLELHE